MLATWRALSQQRRKLALWMILTGAYLLKACSAYLFEPISQVLSIVAAVPSILAVLYRCKLVLDSE